MTFRTKYVTKLCLCLKTMVNQEDNRAKKKISDLLQRKLHSADDSYCRFGYIWFSFRIGLLSVFVAAVSKFPQPRRFARRPRASDCLPLRSSHEASISSSSNNVLNILDF